VDKSHTWPITSDQRGQWDRGTTLVSADTACGAHVKHEFSMYLVYN
jgi:hypothetical protein